MARAAYMSALTSAIKISGVNLSTYFTVSNGSYFFSFSENGFAANNLGVDSSIATTTLTAIVDMRSVSFSYAYETETRYDKFTISVGTTTALNAVSGSSSGTWTGSLQAGQSIVLTYSKDTSKSVDGEVAEIYDLTIDTGQQTYVSRNVIKIYAGVGGIAKNVKRGYIGIGGSAKQFFGSSPIYPSAYLGQTITIGTQEYIVVHITEDIVYVALKYAQIAATYSSDSTYYPESRLYNRMVSWKNAQIPPEYDKYLIAVNHDDAIFPVFSPSVDEMNGGFEYYSSNSRRIFKDARGIARDYWTTTCRRPGSPYIFVVYDDGTVSSNPYAVYETFYDRPHVALSSEAFS